MRFPPRPTRFLWLIHPFTIQAFQRLRLSADLIRAAPLCDLVEFVGDFAVCGTHGLFEF